MNKGLKFLLDKYATEAKAEIINEKSAVVDGVETPLLPWRWERRIIELKNLASGNAASGALSGISVMRTAHIARKGASLTELAKREIDICEYVLSSPVADIFAIGDEENVLNIVAKLSSGVVCTIELSATLAPDAKPIDKHEVIAQKGVACDRVVDTQIPQSSIYMYTDDKNPKQFQDVDAELYGLSIDQVAIVRQTFDMAQKGYDLKNENAHLDELIIALKDSLAQEKKIVTEGGAQK